MDKLTDWLWAAVSGLFMLLWGSLQKRVDTHAHKLESLKKDIETKVSMTEHDRARDNIEKIFDKLDQQGALLARIDTTLTMMQESERTRRSEEQRRTRDVEP